ncbi:MAG: flavin reductase [Candidatus Wallbacteria bacterium]|nr:flavin reductase [Candidatus Wallbacteria bacterium]
MLENIPVKEFVAAPVKAWEDDWLMLASGDFAQGDFNFMTVAWGFFGNMWHKPVAVAVVRPQRHTYQFMERYDSFTLSAFPEQFRQALKLCGSTSGRDTDKVAQSGLTPEASSNVAAPSFREAELVVECRKIYTDDFRPERFLDRGLLSCYPENDFHRFYYGEILSVRGCSRYRGNK